MEPALTDGRRRIAAAIKDYLARERISREQFAFKTRLGKSTVDKLLIGLFSDRTLSIVAGHTKLPLQSMLESASDRPGADTPRAAALKPVDNPSVAVLPFADLGGDPGLEFLADGITEDIITALARLRWLFVIARSSSFVYKGKATDVREVARQLGVRYVLDGSVRTAGQRIRITGQLIDAESGKHIWAEKYDRELQDVFAVQDDIAERVVAAVEPHLYAEEGFRASARPPDSIDAWGLVVRALGKISRITRPENEEAQALLRRAMAIEPGYARAHALLGWAIWWTHQFLMQPDMEEAAGHAHLAMTLDSGDPWARMVHGLCLSTAGRHDTAVAELRTALALNPSFAFGHTALGWALLRAGCYDEAIEKTGRALRLSPLDSFSGIYTSVHGLALLAARRFEEALPHLRESVATISDYSSRYYALISCCGHLGLLEEARHAIELRNRTSPTVSIDRARQAMAKFAHLELFVDGLRKAGVPD